MTTAVQFDSPPPRSNSAVAETVRSFVAGVGDLMPKQAEVARPEISDLKSQEAFERYKEYNTNTNLRVSEKRMWASMAERIAASVLTGASIVLGGIVVAALGGGVFAGVVALTALIGVSLGVFYTMHQPATREQSDKGMDVSDYNIRRSAALIAQEVQKAIQPSALVESKPSTPTPQLASQHEATLEGLASAMAQQTHRS